MYIVSTLTCIFSFIVYIVPLILLLLNECMLPPHLVNCWTGLGFGKPNSIHLCPFSILDIHDVSSYLLWIVCFFAVYSVDGDMMLDIFAYLVASNTFQEIATILSKNQDGCKARF